MHKIKKIPTCDIPDGYYAQHWSKEGTIVRDKVNEIIDVLEEENKGVTVVVNSNSNFLEKECERLREAYGQLLEDFKDILDRNNEAVELIRDYRNNFSDNCILRKIEDVLMEGR